MTVVFILENMMGAYFLVDLKKKLNQYFMNHLQKTLKILHYNLIWIIFVIITNSFYYLKWNSCIKFKYMHNLDPLIKSFINRVPSSVDVEIEKIINGPESFTPDTRMIMGESAEVKNNIFLNKLVNNHNHY